MPQTLIDGVGLYYEVQGDGFPLVWSHEFAGDYRSWKGQVEYFAGRYTVVTYSARGYPPSDVPTDLDAYGQDRAVEDLMGLLDHLDIREAHIGGLSMGGGVALNFGLKYTDRARSLIVAGTGTGSTDPELFRREIGELAQLLETEGMEGMSGYLRGPTRAQLLRKNPAGWQQFADQFHQHSAIGSAMTIRGVQGKRSPIFDLEARLRELEVPTLIMVGDEDDPCIEPSIFMKQCVPRSGLVVFPQSGHAINLEEPQLFNQRVDSFLTAVEADEWAMRGKSAETGSPV